ncbi:transposase [Sagittula salina]|uniref:transposase n=1 Tax=Sagittula salina TaxID=2820268 RepID=UPI003CC91829
MVWTVPDFRTLSRRQKTLVVNIPYRGQGPLHLLIPSVTSLRDALPGSGQHWHQGRG